MQESGFYWMEICICVCFTGTRTCTCSTRAFLWLIITLLLLIYSFWWPSGTCLLTIYIVTLPSSKNSGIIVIYICACMSNTVQCHHCCMFMLELKSCLTATSFVCCLPSSCSSSFICVYCTATSIWSLSWLAFSTETKLIKKFHSCMHACTHWWTYNSPTTASGTLIHDWIKAYICTMTLK